jgi:hypothetical protein
MLSVCLWISPHASTSECLNQSSLNLVQITWHLSPSQTHTSQIPPISVCVSPCVSILSLLGKDSVKNIPPFIASQRLCKHDPTAKNTRNNRIILKCVNFYAIRVVSKRNLWVSLCIPLSFICNNSVKTFLWQRRIVASVIFYVVGVVSKGVGD